MESPTFRLFYRLPNWLDGVARLVDFGAVLNRSRFRISETEQIADAEATAADWFAVGQDFRTVIDRLEWDEPTTTRREEKQEATTVQ